MDESAPPRPAATALVSFVPLKQANLPGVNAHVDRDLFAMAMRIDGPATPR
jgi:hypothetical protein